MSENLIYLDHHATTPTDPRVVEAMAPFWTEKFGNPASFQHEQGRKAARAVEAATAQIASLLNADPTRLIFTSGATESNNLALKGILQPQLRLAASGGTTPHVITSQVEHRSIIDPLKKLERRGVKVTWLNVDQSGQIDLDELNSAFRPETCLVTLIWANNEVGTIHPLREISDLCNEHQVPCIPMLFRSWQVTPRPVTKSRGHAELHGS
ncbi:MAG: aminotransferase class V-fold PLP-dependent enzyme [Planctomycetaceae bacterium]